MSPVPPSPLSTVSVSWASPTAYGGTGLSASSRFSGAIAAHIDLSEPAGPALEAHADALWGDQNLIGIVLTYGGGAVLHQCKKMGLLVDCTMEAKAIATGKAAEVVTFAREVGRAIGAPCNGLTLIGTDDLQPRQPQHRFRKGHPVALEALPSALPRPRATRRGRRCCSAPCRRYTDGG